MQDEELPLIEVTTAPAESELEEGAFRIAGVVGDNGSPPRLALNGEQLPLFKLDANSQKVAEHTLAFRVDVTPTKQGEQRFVLEATDAAGNVSTKEFAVRITVANRPTITGKNYALIIGNNEYDALPDLKTAVGDAECQGVFRDLLGIRIEVTTAPAESELEEGAFRIAGVVGDNGSPPRLALNGEQLPLFKLDANSQKVAEHTLAFRVDVTPTKQGEQRFVLEATDAAGNVSTKEFAVRITVANRPTITGKNYALIIGNNEYDALPDLKTAVGDAEALAAILRDRYLFEKDAINLLLNVTRRDIMRQLSKLRRTLKREDRLLVYYAGHGQIDPATDQGFWQPVNAEPGNDFTWISNDDLKRYLRAMPAKHVLVIADSCFSGSLTRGATTQDQNADKFFLKIDQFASRKIISSGGTEPVADTGSGGHSVFAYYLIKALTANKKPYITSFQLFDRLARAVTNNSNQKPEYGTVSEAGDEGSGDFTFILRPKPG